MKTPFHIQYSANIDPPIEIDEDTECDVSGEYGWRTAVLDTQGATLEECLNNARIYEQDRETERHAGEAIDWYGDEVLYVSTLIIVEHLIDKKRVLNESEVQAQYDENLKHYQAWCRNRRRHNHGGLSLYPKPSH